MVKLRGKCAKKAWQGLLHTFTVLSNRHRESDKEANKTVVNKSTNSLENEEVSLCILPRQKVCKMTLIHES